MRKWMNNRVTTGVMAAVLAVTMLTGCGSMSSDTIKIGTSFPMTGSCAADGLLILDAIDLAVEEVNAAGGINGKTVEIVKEDDEANPTSAASIANKFAEDKSIVGVLSAYNSSCMFAQVDTLEEAKLPTISPVSTNPGFTGISDYFYRTSTSDAVVGEEGALFSKDLGMTSVAVLYENDDYGLGIADEYMATCEEIGLNIATVQTYVYGETVDYSTILTACADAGADGIFIAGVTTEAGLICEQKDDYGCGDMIVVGANGLYSPAFLEYGSAVEGVYLLGEFSTESEKESTQEFVKAFREKYDEDPSNWAALAYDAAMVMMEAMKSIDGDVTREALNEAISNIEYDGAAGTYKFENCDCEIKNELRFVIEDGKFTLY